MTSSWICLTALSQQLGETRQSRNLTRPTSTRSMKTKGSGKINISCVTLVFLVAWCGAHKCKKSRCGDKTALQTVIPTIIFSILVKQHQYDNRSWVKRQYVLHYQGLDAVLVGVKTLILLWKWTSASLVVPHCRPIGQHPTNISWILNPARSGIW